MLRLTLPFLSLALLVAVLLAGWVMARQDAKEFAHDRQVAAIEGLPDAPVPRAPGGLDGRALEDELEAGR